MNDSTSSPDQVFHHPNKLQISIDFDHSEVVQDEAGFSIYLAPKNARQQDQIKIEYRDQAPPGLTEEKEVAGTTFRFKQERYHGGSGGEEKILTIWKPISANKGILTEHYVQGDSSVDSGRVWDLAIAAE